MLLKYCLIVLLELPGSAFNKPTRKIDKTCVVNLSVMANVREFSGWAGTQQKTFSANFILKGRLGLRFRVRLDKVS